jgi:hypothetical protein
LTACVDVLIPVRTTVLGPEGKSDAVEYSKVNVESVLPLDVGVERPTTRFVPVLVSVGVAGWFGAPATIVLGEEYALLPSELVASALK